MNKKQLNRLITAIDDNGLDHAMHQSDWSDIDDEDFHSYLAQYRVAAYLLNRYIEKVEDLHRTNT